MKLSLCKQNCLFKYPWFRWICILIYLTMYEAATVRVKDKNSNSFLCTDTERPNVLLSMNHWQKQFQIKLHDHASLPPE